MREIDSEWLEEFKNYLLYEAKSKSGKSLAINSCVSYFNKILATLKQAVKEEILIKNPADAVDPIKEEETVREYLTHSELKSLINTDYTKNTVKRAFIFACLTGLRFSDVQNLKWLDIKHEDNLGYSIRFRQQKTKSVESLPITEDAYNIIQPRMGDHDSVFIDLNYGNETNKLLRTWMKEAAINKDLTFHASRHTFAVLQLTLGTDIYTVSKLLGHKSIKTTEIYAKIVDQKKIEAVNKISLNILK